MSFTFHFKYYIVFKNIIDISKDIVDDVPLFFSKDGISMESMDRTHISLVHFFLGRENFKEVYIERECYISLRLKTLALILKCWKEKDELIISYIGGNTIDLTLREPNQQYFFSLPLIQMEPQGISIPKDLSFDAIFMIPSFDFFQIMKNINMIGPFIEFETIGKLLNIKNQGDLGSVCVTREFNKDSMKTFKNIKLLISTKYLNIFARGTFVAKELKISLKEEHPLHLHFKIGENTFLEFFIAPKFED